MLYRVAEEKSLRHLIQRSQFCGVGFWLETDGHGKRREGNTAAALGRAVSRSIQGSGPAKWTLAAHSLALRLKCSERKVQETDGAKGRGPDTFVGALEQNEVSEPKNKDRQGWYEILHP